MGVNLGHLAQQLGLGGQPTQNPNYSQASAVPTPGMGPRALLGAVQPQDDQRYPVDSSGQLPAVAPSQMPQVASAPAQAPEAPIDPNAEISVTGSRPPQATPEDFGMPGLPHSSMPNKDTITQMRQDLINKSELARQLYHPKSEFGTHGVLRDVIGNASDFGRRLLGFAPRYNAEKSAEREYGMTSSDPNVAAASYEGARQYNAGSADSYQKDIVAQQASRANTAATTGYKDAQANARYANMLSGLGSGLLSAGLAGPDAANTAYQRALPAIQANLDQIYGAGVYQAPPQYEEAFARQLAQTGYTGANVQRAQSNVMDNMTRREIANGRNLTSVEVAHIGADARKYAADVGYRAAVNRAVVAGQDITTIEDETPTGSIVQPGKHTTRTVTKSPSAGGGGSAPQYKYFNGKRYTRGPNGEAIEAPE